MFGQVLNTPLVPLWSGTSSNYSDNYRRIAFTLFSNTSKMFMKASQENINYANKFQTRAGKIRFSGERNFMLLKTSSGARCAPCNFVLLVTLRLQVLASLCTSPCTK